MIDVADADDNDVNDSDNDNVDADVDDKNHEKRSSRNVSVLSVA
ncbi:unnamed protein product [Trichobilharzia regenti]|nr:unnamed protein product [Trichobilharzia regenti]